MRDGYIILPGGRPTTNKLVSDSKVYGINLADDLDAGDSIATATATASGLTVGSPFIDGTQIKALVSAGTPGQTGSVRFDYTTTLGTAGSVTLYFRVIAG